MTLMHVKTFGTIHTRILMMVGLAVVSTSLFFAVGKTKYGYSSYPQPEVGPNIGETVQLLAKAGGSIEMPAVNFGVGSFPAVRRLFFWHGERRQIQVYVYYSGAAAGGDGGKGGKGGMPADGGQHGREIAKWVTKWTAVGGMDTATFAKRLKLDRIDIAVDMSGHTGGQRLDSVERSCVE